MKEAQDLINDCEWESDGIQSTITLKNVEKLMIEFAKLHVEAALQNAAQNAKHIHSAYDNDFKIDKQSILDAYPLTNIK